MILLISDLHLGRGSQEESRRAEHDAIELLETYRPLLARRNGEVVLLGDVFNAYMEYASMAPPGFLRFRSALAETVDAGVPVWYVLGNRDQWQMGHFAQETGVRIVPERICLHRWGQVIHCEHGDALMRRSPAYRLIRPVLRSRVAFVAFRTLLPGDVGFRFARFIGDRGSGEAEGPIIDDVRAAARRVLTKTDATLAALGHSHHAEISSWPEGTYVNPGYWFADRTYALLDRDARTLLTWPERTAELHEESTGSPQHPHPPGRSRPET